MTIYRRFCKKINGLPHMKKASFAFFFSNNFSLLFMCLFYTASFMGLNTHAKAYEAAKHHAFPDRDLNAKTGTEFVANLEGLSGFKREEAIIRELEQGNVPDMLRFVLEVPFGYTTKKGEIKVAKIYSLPDYLAIGSNDDYVHMPMTPGAAQYIATKLGFVLPTRKIVNTIYEAATVKHAPKPIAPGKHMTTVKTYLKHSLSISRKGISQKKPHLQAGHKKDVVQTNKALLQPHRVAIYGWHRPSGKPIQNLSLVHGANYADYSHGIRLVLDRMQVDGSWVSTEEVLKSKRNWKLLSDEGPIKTHIETMAGI